VEHAKLRAKIVELAHQSGEGHLGSSLSAIDLINCVYTRFDVGSKIDDTLFVLSKGHASLALYAVLHQHDFISDSELHNFCQAGSRLGGHPDALKVPTVTASTGSLGHGFPFAAGMAFAKKLANKANPVICLVGDGECNEGTTWEASLLSVTHHLDNLVLIVDVNRSGERAIPVDSIMNQFFCSLGFNVQCIDGHCTEDIYGALDRAVGSNGTGRPTAILARTIKGRGVSFMENNPEWHHKWPDEVSLQKALQELGGSN